MNSNQTPHKYSSLGLFFHQLGSFVRPYRWRLLEAFIYMLLNLTFALLLPLGSKYLIDTVIPERQFGLLGLFVIILLLIYLSGTLLQFRRTYVIHWVTQRTLANLQKQMFSHLSQLSHRYYNRAKAGDIMVRFTSDLQIVEEAMSQVLDTGIFMAINMVAAALTIMILDTLLASLVLLIMPVLFLCYLVLERKIKPVSKRLADLGGQTATNLGEAIEGQELIKAFNLQQKSKNTYNHKVEAVFGVNIQLIKLTTWFETSINLAINIGQLVVLSFGGWLVIQDDLSMGTLVAFIGLMPALFQPVASLSSVIQYVQTANGSLERIRQLLAEPVEIAEDPAATAVTGLNRELRLENITFGYQPGQPILKNLNLTIQAGKHTAIVGPSGSGKSTLVNLLMRFYDPDQGGIYFDDHNIRQVKLASLRQQIGLVGQNSFIFDTNVRENIAIGKSESSDGEISEVARAIWLNDAKAYHPAGLDGSLGERGIRMSSGQRQRLALARVLLCNPSILVLDNATDALDSRSEREILEMLYTTAKHRTIISITNRLGLAAAADQVIVLDNGQVVAQGSHWELVNAGGWYQQLYEEQRNYSPEPIPTTFH